MRTIADYYDDKMFKLVMKSHRIFSLPAMTVAERKIYKKILLAIKVNTRLNIFEYGSGFSTIYTAKFLKKNNIPFHIYSIDNNLFWHNKVKHLVKIERLDDVVSLYLREFPPFWEKEGWEWKVVPQCGKYAPMGDKEHEYIKFPLSLGEKYDFVLIDGRFRRRCLKLIAQCLSEKGVVFLHDAHKAWYHEPLSLFKYSQMIDSGKYYPLEGREWKIWLGSLNNFTFNEK